MTGWVWAGLLGGILGLSGWAHGDEVCMECHDDPELVREGEWRQGSSVFVDTQAFVGSVHEGVDCVECHVDASEDHDPRLTTTGCADCHEEVQAQFAGSVHAVAQKRGDADAPGCADCHGGHHILYVDDPQSPVYRTNVPLTCATCHGSPGFSRRHPLAPQSPLAGYERSVHYAALQRTEDGATCTDCHRSHALYAQNDPRSAIFDQNVPATCGKCHGDIEQVYERSIHGRALAAGQLDAPDCTDCHGEHEIRGPQDPKSSVYPARISRTTCVWCHESERIVKRYGLPARRQQTYADSYHGLAERGGSTVVANCASCHGIHDILPSSDPRSSVHPDNIPRTCGKCHPGADANFSRGKVHIDPGVDRGQHPVVVWVRRFYLWLIVAVIGAMALHNGFDLARKGRTRGLRHALEYLRFTVNERLQHGVTALAFLVLAYSGFALKFPGAWWAQPFVWFGPGEAARRLVHRAAAVAMVTVCLYHLGYLALSRRGRQQLMAMLPHWQDVTDAAHMVDYYLGRQGHGPAFDRFSYMEKLEYWALAWGSAVMTVTGFTLWFENEALSVVPLWVMDLATVVHYYEAWLAALAILVWHIYWVVFSPDVYPMSKVWVDGHLSEEEMRHEHPLELARLQGRGPTDAQGTG